MKMVRVKRKKERKKDSKTTCKCIKTVEREKLTQGNDKKKKWRKKEGKNLKKKKKKKKMRRKEKSSAVWSLCCWVGWINKKQTDAYENGRRAGSDNSKMDPRQSKTKRNTSNKKT